MDSQELSKAEHGGSPVSHGDREENSGAKDCACLSQAIHTECGAETIQLTAVWNVQEDKCLGTEQQRNGGSTKATAGANALGLILYG